MFVQADGEDVILNPFEPPVDPDVGRTCRNEVPEFVPVNQFLRMPKPVCPSGFYFKKVQPACLGSHKINLPMAIPPVLVSYGIAIVLSPVEGQLLSQFSRFIVSCHNA